MFLLEGTAGPRAALHLSALSAGCNEGHRHERANALGVLAAARGSSSRPIASNISSWVVAADRSNAQFP